MVSLNPPRLAYQIYNSIWFGLTSRFPIGFNVFEEEWDVLVLLDTCRVDALREVAPEYEWLSKNKIDKRWSIGSNSRGWIASTFTEEYIETIHGTVYVNANGYASEILERGRRFPSEDGLWDISKWSTVSADELLLHHCVREYSPDYRLKNHAPPDLVLDRALSAYQEYEPKRLIVHFHQPHTPFHARAVAEDDSLFDWEQDPFSALKKGEISFKTIWEAYLDELRWGLDCVDILRRVLDVETIAISSDHGEAFGEWGMYRHMLGIPHPQMKQVPWVEIEGVGTKDDYEISFPIDEIGKFEKDVQEAELEARLQALGYT